MSYDKQHWTITCQHFFPIIPHPQMLESVRWLLDSPIIIPPLGPAPLAPWLLHSLLYSNNFNLIHKTHHNFIIFANDEQAS